MFTVWDLVCDVELAIKLVELGVPESSLFLYMKYKQRIASNGEPIKSEWGIMYIHEYCNLESEEDFKMSNYHIVPAFTAPELGKILPTVLEPRSASGSPAYLEANKDVSNRWLISYVVNDNTPPKISMIGKNEADARALMLIYLLEKGWLKLK